MTYWDAFLRLKQLKRNGRPLRSDRCAALLGYALLVQLYGGDWKRLDVARQTAYAAKKDLADAGVDPMQVDFSERVSVYRDAMHMDPETRALVLSHMGVETGTFGDDR